MEKQIAKMSQLIEEEIFSQIDLQFAKVFLKGASSESALFLLCYILAAARNGHLCLEIRSSKIFPSPDFLTVNREKQQEIEQEVLRGVDHLSADLCTLVDKEQNAVTTPLCRYGDLIYLQKNWLLETHFLRQLERISSSSLRLELPTLSPISSLLNEKQKQAVSLALSSPLSFISGGPGTGKTFTAAEIVKVFLDSVPADEREKVLIKMAAPTGKAAAHLEKKIAANLPEGVSVECGTLHSLLRVGFKQNIQEPKKALFADLLLIDEASMLDAKLFSRLLASFQEGGRLVFMGDKNQLPPVESGALFADLVDLAEKISLPAISLEECLRVEKKEMMDFARGIIQGDVQSTLSSSYMRCYKPSNIQEIKELIWEKCKMYFSHVTEEKGSFRILSCIRKGPLGVESLNEMILRRFLEDKEDDVIFSAPILITENNEPLSLMNGDVGYLTAKVSSFKRRRFSLDDKVQFGSRSFSALLLPSFEWGYCLSVHKSQGSEYDFVIALAPQGSEGFGKEVLYTAVTRAKKEILLLGEQEILASLLSKSSRKMSGLEKRFAPITQEV